MVRWLLSIIALIAIVLGYCLSSSALWTITVLYFGIWIGAIIYFKVEYDDHEPLDRLGFYYGFVLAIAFLLPMWLVHILLHR